MADATIPVDLRNPGQVMACLGLMEAAAVLFAVDEPPTNVIGRYSWDMETTDARFTLGVAGGDDPVLAVIRFLTQAAVSSFAPERLRLRTEQWQVPTRVDETECFPFSPPDSPAPLPIRITATAPDGTVRALLIEHWGDSAAIGRDNIKFWAGSGGYPGAALANDAVQSLAGIQAAVLQSTAADPFAWPARMSSSFRFDWRRDYVPLDAGFSPNRHGDMTMVGYPLVELLAAIGLQHARPERIDKLNYRYSVSTAALPLPFARAVLAGQSLGFPARTFRMRLGWPGQEGQARCILDSQEEICS